MRQTEIVLQLHHATHTTARQWTLPINLAIGFHLLLALSVVYLPGVLRTQHVREQAYMVNLINVADLPSPQSAAAKPVQPVIKHPKKAVSIAHPAPAPPPAEEKAISIKPLKRKVVKKVVRHRPPPKRDLNAIKRRKLAEMLQAEQQAAEQAKILADEAALEEKLAEADRRRMAEANRNAYRSPSPAAPGPSGAQVSALENQYGAAIVARIQAYWSLPEYKNWEKSLLAQVVITVEKDGRIADSVFERHSGDSVFDRFVTKTLRDVQQLPPIPPAMGKQRMEIVLNFTPKSIH